MPAPETKTTNLQTPLLFLTLAVLVIMRTLPLLKGPLGSFGYDYGFYLYAISHQAAQYPHAWLVALWGGYNNPLFFLSFLLHLPPSFMLNELYFLAGLGLGLAAFLLLRPSFPKAAVAAVFLTACSLIQAEGYFMYLWKNVVALPLLLLGFKFLQEKKYKAFAACSLGIFLTHRTTALIYFATIVLYFSIQLLKQKQYRRFLMLAIGLATVAAALFYGLHLQTLAWDLINNANTYVRDGLFLDGQNLAWLLWPYLLLAVPGLYLEIKNRQTGLMTIFTGLGLLWFGLRLPFYRRFLIYLDLSLIYYAARFLGNMHYGSWLKKIALAIVLGLLAWQAYSYIASRQPLISREEIAEIKNFDRPGSFVLAVSAADAPWLLGYSHDVRLGAPGLFEDYHTYQDWINFWSGQVNKEFLNTLPQPLFLYERSYHMQTPITQCLRPLSNNFFEFICK